jgi:hypothetical protein
MRFRPMAPVRGWLILCHQQNSMRGVGPAGSGNRYKLGERRTMATVGNAGTAVIGVTEGSGASMVILIAMIILFGGAAYFTGRVYAEQG